MKSGISKEKKRKWKKIRWQNKMRKRKHSPMKKQKWKPYERIPKKKNVIKQRKKKQKLNKKGKWKIKWKLKMKMKKNETLPTREEAQ